MNGFTDFYILESAAADVGQTAELAIAARSIAAAILP
jgi:hypothetical protein